MILFKNTIKSKKKQLTSGGSDIGSGDDNANIHSGHDSESSVEAHEILGAALSF